MPLPVAHGLLGASLVAAIYPQPTKRYFIPLSKAWHRGFSHSIILALIVCLIFLFLLGKRHIREAIAYSLAFASHGILDYVTTKEGGGVELLWPFSSERLVLGWAGLSELPSR